MSTRKLSDKEFDRYTRNILKKPEGVAFDKSAWAAMEQKMAVEGSSPSIFNLKWIIPAGIILLSSLGYFGYQILDNPDNVVTERVIETPTEVQPSNDKIVVNQEEESNSSASDLSASLAITSSTERATNNELAEITNESSQAANQSVEESSTTNVDQEVAEEPSTPNQRFSSDENSAGFIEENSTEDNNEKEVSEKRTVENTNVDQSESSETSGSPTEEIELKDTQKPLTKQSAILPSFPGKEDEDGYQENSASKILQVESKQASVDIVLIDRNQIIPLPEISFKEQSIPEPEERDEESIHSFSRWSVGLILAPDFSTVGQFNEFTQPGVDFGLTVEYFIRRRLSVTTGAVLTRKIYNTSDIEQYTVPQGFWNGSQAPEEILANCQVIDIPINLRYRVVEGKRTTFFLSAGMSSYLMLNERYDYDYGYQGSNGSQPEGWEVSNENNHFFGVYNLSAGINRRIGKNFSIEAEPFMKNSLGGVGWGQVRLRSTGMHLHLKYNF